MRRCCCISRLLPPGDGLRVAAMLLVTPCPGPLPSPAQSVQAVPVDAYRHSASHRQRTDSGIYSAKHRPPIPMPLPLLLLLPLGKTTPRAEATSPKNAEFATPSLSSELRASHWSWTFRFQELQLPLSGPTGVVGVASELFSTPLGLCRHCCWPCCCCCCCLGELERPMRCCFYCRGWSAGVASITAADGSIRSR
ncbi:uncharacterized protein LOC116801677 [Drosophila sechellia]|uniref:uncharacterized protein LOC116801677 n=1 Tax=Drosophila sechellia TaxID=7238 RepID=UPI0013DE6B9C|nr:uncharacterized protein LOC116801677 [Drosophila sechellia]